MEFAVIVGEAFLSSLFQVLLGKLGSLKFPRKEKIDAELKRWTTILADISQVLEDAEDKQSTKPYVKRWLNDLRDLAYDADDILDDISTEALRREAEEKSKSKYCSNLLPDLISSFSPEMENKIQEITTRLQDIASQKNPLGLKEDGGMTSLVRERLPTTCLVNESLVYGREKDKGAILELMKAEASDSKVSVIPIQGMGGVGKTTLAQFVFNETQVKFDPKVWVCVSDNFDIPRITKTVLQSVASEENCDGKDLNWLQLKLKEKLTGNKFLIVLDDVWNEEYGDWIELRKPFEAGALGSKIIVTTRNQRVSSIMVSNPTDPVYRLKEVSHDECLRILAQHALGKENFDDHHPNLKKIGEEIARKCKGLPLAARVIGGFLRGKKYDKWVEILNNNMWDEAGTILPALRLSYSHLPSKLKQCFAYCAIFPKDYEFDRDELVLLWMAEGFLQQAEGNKQMETLGRECFEVLLSRSFFQQTKNKMRFVMHDLIHDLAESVSGEIYFHLDEKTKSASSKKTRHSSFISSQYEVSKRFEVYNKLTRLRTFAALPLRSWNLNYYISSKVLHDLLPKLRCLRVLSLGNYLISELPSSICELKHLRYLNLSSAVFEELPDSIGDLYNLQVLLLRECTHLTKLPQHIKNLIYLRCLDINGTNNLKEMPSEIGCLTSLRELSKFVVGKGDGLRLKDLKDLSHLQGELSITGLHNVADIQDAGVANLKDKCDLHELCMDWGNNFNGNSRNEKVEMHVMDMLEPHKNLRGLTIAYFGGRKFSSWLSDPSFAEIVRLHIRGCEKITLLPSLGRLPSLKNLHVENMGGVKSVGLEFYGDASNSVMPFSSLETLTFKDMLEWKEWSSCTNVDGCKFPNLHELQIVNCPKLVEKLPSHPTSLVKLSIHKCPMLAFSNVTCPSLRELELEECNEVILKSMIELNSLTTLRMKNISEFKCFHEGLMQFLVALEVLVIEDCEEMTILWEGEIGGENLTCLKELKIIKCSKLASFPMGGVPLSLKLLLVRDCEALALLFDNINNCIIEEVEIINCPNLVSLGGVPLWSKKLVVENCQALELLFDNINNCILEEVKITACSKLVSLGGVPLSLKNLVVENCQALEELFHNINNCILEKVEICGCSSLKFLPGGKLPATLNSLAIRNCENLQSLTEVRMNDNPHLKSLKIINCPSLKGFPIEESPTALKDLQIGGCTQLEESVLEKTLLRNTTLQSFTIWNGTKVRSIPGCLSLTSLSIDHCPGLESFPQRGLRIPNLTSLILNSCKDLKSLPNRMKNLISLQDLHILSCPNIESIPEGGLPPNLTSLIISDCQNMKQPLSEWGLQRLTSLRRLQISGECDAFRRMVFFPDDCTLPDTLTKLTIGNFLNMEGLSRGLQNLTSLEELRISECPKLQSLPKESLPSALGSVWIEECPLLKTTGEYWAIRAHIPHISICNRECSAIDNLSWLYWEHSGIPEFCDR